MPGDASMATAPGVESAAAGSDDDEPEVASAGGPEDAAAAEAARLKRAAKNKAKKERAKANKAAEASGGGGGGSEGESPQRAAQRRAPRSWRKAHQRPRRAPRSHARCGQEQSQGCDARPAAQTHVANPAAVAPRAADAPPRPAGGAAVQTEPPSVPIATFFPAGRYPEGEIQEYRDECVVARYSRAAMSCAATAGADAPRRIAATRTVRRARSAASASGLTRTCTTTCERRRRCTVQCASTSRK